MPLPVGRTLVPLVLFDQLVLAAHIVLGAGRTALGLGAGPVVVPAGPGRPVPGLGHTAVGIGPGRTEGPAAAAAGSSFGSPGPVVVPAGRPGPLAVNAGPIWRPGANAGPLGRLVAVNAETLGPGLGPGPAAGTGLAGPRPVARTGPAVDTALVGTGPGAVGPGLGPGPVVGSAGTVAGPLGPGPGTGPVPPPGRTLAPEHYVRAALVGRPFALDSSFRKRWQERGPGRRRWARSHNRSQG